MKMSQTEADFFQEFKKLEILEKEKGIKFFECVGDPPITDEFVENVNVKRQNYIQDGLDHMRDRDVARFTTQVDTDKPVIPVKNEIVSQPKWDVYSNHQTAMRKRLNDIFLKVANKVIIRIRAGRHLTCIRNWLIENQITTRDQCREMVALDYKQALNNQFDDSGNADPSNIDAVKFEFNFNLKHFQDRVRLPVQYEQSMALFSEPIDTNPVVTFDDLEEFDPIEQLDFEVMEYKPFALPAISTYDPVYDDKILRPGCEYESALRQRAGEPDLEKTQLHAHEQMELLKQPKKDIVSGANVEMPKTFVKPFDYSVDLLIRSHPTLRTYCKQLPCTETEPTYHLHPTVRPRIEPKDEIERKNVRLADKLDSATITKTISGSFVNQTDVAGNELPGNFGVRALEIMPSNMRDVFITQQNNVECGYTCDNKVC